MSDLKSRLRPNIADHKADGPDTVLVIEGFSGRDEIEWFLATLEESGVFIKPREIPLN